MPFPPDTPHRMVLLIGPPAAGKSSLMRSLTGRWTAWPRPDATLPHVLYLDHHHEVQAAEIGILRADFPGTDALGHTAIETAIPWTATRPAPLLLVEGSRLAVRRYVEAAHASTYHVLVVLLDTPDETELDRRCATRGSHQSLPWRRGQATRARVLADWAATHPQCSVLRLDATTPTATLSEQLWKEIHP